MSESRRVIWQSGSNTVTQSTVKTRRITVSLDDVDIIEVRRPLCLPMLGLATVVTLLVLRFFDVLWLEEMSALLGGAWSLFAIACCIGTLKLHSYSIDDLEITLPVWRAHAMRNAIDEVISLRPGNMVNRKRGKRLECPTGNDTGHRL